MKKYSFKNNRERYTELLIDCIGAAIIAGYHNHADILHGLSCDVMGLTIPKKCAMMIKAGIEPEKIGTEGKRMKIQNIVEKINNSCKPFALDDLHEIFTAANSAEGIEMLQTVSDTDEIPLEIIDSALYNLGYEADSAGTYRKIENE